MVWEGSSSALGWVGFSPLCRAFASLVRLRKRELSLSLLLVVVWRLVCGIPVGWGASWMEVRACVYASVHRLWFDAMLDGFSFQMDVCSREVDWELVFSFLCTYGLAEARWCMRV